MKQIKINLENKPGKLAKACTELGKVGVNIDAMFGKGLDSKGTFHFVTSDPETAERSLKKSGFKPEVTDILSVTLRDRPGELGKLTRKLAHKDINIESIYIIERVDNELKIALRTDDMEKTRRITSE